MGYKEDYEKMAKELRDAGCSEEYIRSTLGDPPEKEPPVPYTRDWLMSGPTRDDLMKGRIRKTSKKKRHED